jgi:hypothetical protein
LFLSKAKIEKSDAADEEPGKTVARPQAKKAKVQKLDSNGLPTRVEPSGDAGVLKSFAQGGTVLQ